MYVTSIGGVTQRTTGPWTPPAGATYTKIIGTSSTAILLLGSHGSPPVQRDLALWNGSTWTTMTAPTEIMAATVDTAGHVAIARTSPVIGSQCLIETGTLPSLSFVSAGDCPKS